MGTFILSACGDEHVRRARVALKLLKARSRSDIVVVRSRSDVELDHDQVVDFEPPAHFSDLQVSRLQKTAVNRIVPLDGLCCYLDSDVLAVSDQVDMIFDRHVAPIVFAPDHQMTTRSFARYALTDAADGERDLAEAIGRDFGIKVEPDWPIWNSGVYVFGSAAHEFLDYWRQLILQAMSMPAWTVRDQGVLVASIWKFGLQQQSLLPVTFNWMARLSVSWSDVLSGGPRGFFYRSEKIHFLHYTMKSRCTWELLKALEPHGISPDEFLESNYRFL